MKKIGLGFIGLAILSLTSCSHQKSYWMSQEKINTLKEVSINSDAQGAPWLSEISIYLKQKGFDVKRSSSLSTVTNKSKESDATYNQSATRYILKIDGAVNYKNRCFGGGFVFDYLSVELYDSQENKSILNVSDSGYSEGCPPAWSDMFENVATQVSMAWEK